MSDLLEDDALWAGEERRSSDRVARQWAKTALSAIAKHEQECADRWRDVQKLLASLTRYLVYALVGLVGVFATLWARTQGWL